jgi:hypothetical protein
MKFSKIFRSPILRRKSTRWLVMANLAVYAVLVTFVASQVRPQDFAVPARFSSLNEFVMLSRWYWHFIPAVFLGLAFIVNLMLASVLLKASESVEIQRFAVKVMLFQLILSLLTFTVAYQLIKAAAL